MEGAAIVICSLAIAIMVGIPVSVILNDIKRRQKQGK